MIFGVMSDTHGNRKLMFRAADMMTKDLGAELIFHLGDDYADAEELHLAGYTVRHVPGLWCDEYHDSRIPRQLLETVDGVTVSLAHAEKDLRHTELRADIILLGHTHDPVIQRLGHSLHVNPGHLKAPSDRGRPATFAIVEVATGHIRAAIHDIHGRLLMRNNFPRD